MNGWGVGGNKVLSIDGWAQFMTLAPPARRKTAPRVTCDSDDSTICAQSGTRCYPQ